MDGKPGQLLSDHLALFIAVPGIAWVASTAVLVWSFLTNSITSPIIGLASFTTATATLFLVLVTYENVKINDALTEQNRALVEETRNAWVQEVSPTLTPEFLRGLRPDTEIQLRNVGQGPTHNVSGKVTPLPAGEEH